MEGEIRLEELCKKFDDFVAVDGIDIDMPPGEFFTLLGPSGCGKTTTLRMIAGFERPTSGRILLDGNDVARVPPHQRNVNTVFQSYALFPHLDVAKNVAFGLKYHKLSKEERAKRVGEALELVSMTEFARRKADQLSGGQQQRVALARALVLRPRVLLLDEPLGALDAQLRKNLQVELKALQAELGITFIFVTHDQSEALTMSDRVAVMNRRSRRAGRPAEGDLRGAGDGLRRGLPGCLEPARRHGGRPGRRRLHGPGRRPHAARAAGRDQRARRGEGDDPARAHRDRAALQHRRRAHARHGRAVGLPGRLVRGARPRARRRAAQGHGAERRQRLGRAPWSRARRSPCTCRPTRCACSRTSEPAEDEWAVKESNLQP